MERFLQLFGLTEKWDHKNGLGYRAKKVSVRVAVSSECVLLLYLINQASIWYYHCDIYTPISGALYS